MLFELTPFMGLPYTVTALTFGLAELAKHTLIRYETSVTGTVGRLMLEPPGTVTLYYTVLGVARSP